MEIQYRIATINDLVDIKDITNKMLKDTKLGLALDRKIVDIIMSPRTFKLLATDKNNDNKIVGFIAGIVHESVFNDIKRVTDIGVFVDDDYRSTKIGITLINRLEEWARLEGAKQLWFTQSTGLDVEITGKFFERLGFTKQGYTNLKEL